MATLSLAEFTSFLIDEIDDGNESFVTDLLASAKAKIVAGGGVIDSMTSGSRNGKSYTMQIGMDAATVAKACRDALRTTDDTDGNPVFTVPSFQNIVASNQ
jgi:hypothetical protein